MFPERLSSPSIMLLQINIPDMGNPSTSQTSSPSLIPRYCFAGLATNRSLTSAILKRFFLSLDLEVWKPIKVILYSYWARWLSMSWFKETSQKIFSKSPPRKKTFHEKNYPNSTINHRLSNFEPGSGQGVLSIDWRSHTEGKPDFKL